MQAVGAGEEDKLLQMVLIFVWKNERKELHLTVVNELEVLSLGLRSVFIVENRALGLVELECMR